MLAGKISALKYFPNCFWDSVAESDQWPEPIVLDIFNLKIRKSTR